MISTRSFGVAAAVLLVASSSAADVQQAATLHRLSRTETLGLVKQENLSLLAARHRLSQSRAEVVSAGVWTNPNVSASAVLLTHGAVTGGRAEVIVSVDQVVPLAGQIGLRREVARGFLSAEERAFAATAWQLASDAKVAYLELQRTEARARAVRVGLADLGRVETIVEGRASAGAISPYDRVRASAERSKLESRRAQAEVDITVAQAALAQAIGKSVDARTVTTGEDPIDEPGDAPADLEALVRRAIVSRPEVGSAKARADASELRITSLKRQYIPSPDISAGYARYLDVPGSGGISGGALVLGLSFPVPLLDRGQGTIDRGISAAAEERANRENVELAVRRQVEQAAGAMAVRVQAWRHFRDAGAKDLSRLRAIAELSYKEGRATILELLDAYATSLEGEERSIELRVAAARSSLDLERALGPDR